MSYLLTPEAESNLLEIVDYYIAQESLDAADRVLTAFERAFEHVAAHPGHGHFRDNLLDHRHRFWTVFSYQIAYRWEQSPVQIIAIVHGARDLPGYFSVR